MKSIAQKIEKIEKLQKVETPWQVMRSGIEPEIHGEQVILTKWDGADYLSLEEARDVVCWLAEQLGMEVQLGDE